MQRYHIWRTPTFSNVMILVESPTCSSLSFLANTLLEDKGQDNKQYIITDENGKFLAVCINGDLAHAIMEGR